MLGHYGVDTLSPGVSVRRVWVLLRRLPPGSWPNERSPMSWSLESHLLASVIDSLAVLTAITIRAAGGRPPTVKPVPRPKAAPLAPTGPRTSWSELAASLAGQRGVSVRRG